MLLLYDYMLALSSDFGECFYLVVQFYFVRVMPLKGVSSSCIRFENFLITLTLFLIYFMQSSDDLKLCQTIKFVNRR